MRHWTRLFLFTLLVKIGLIAQSQPLTFTGDKTSWHGFDRYDFVMDEQTLADNTRMAEQLYKKLGGKINVVIREEEGHFLTAKGSETAVDFITGCSK
jgi:hypothetical protein